MPMTTGDLPLIHVSRKRTGIGGAVVRSVAALYAELFRISASDVGIELGGEPFVFVALQIRQQIQIP